MNALQVLNFFNSKTVWAFFRISGDGRSTVTFGEVLRQEFAKRLMLTNTTGVRRQGTACTQKKIKVLLPSSSVGSTVSKTDRSEESIAKFRIWNLTRMRPKRFCETRTISACTVCAGHNFEPNSKISLNLSIGQKMIFVHGCWCSTNLRPEQIEI